MKPDFARCKSLICVSSAFHLWAPSFLGMRFNAVGTRPHELASWVSETGGQHLRTTNRNWVVPTDRPMTQHLK